MSESKYNSISKTDFLALNEEDVMFITNPGRMGDEDGITFVIREENQYIKYRVDGLIYPNRNSNEKDRITLEDVLNQFPKWYEAWKHGDEKDYEGKYKHIYMGFGNGLNVDHSIYEEYKPYLEKAIEEKLKQYDEKEREGMQYAAIFNVWEKALDEMLEEKNKNRR